MTKRRFSAYCEKRATSRYRAIGHIHQGIFENIDGSGVPEGRGVEEDEDEDEDEGAEGDFSPANICSFLEPKVTGAVGVLLGGPGNCLNEELRPLSGLPDSP